MSFAEILKYFAPKGWFLPVTPGTKFITVGGAIAADVHGKNHHKVGSFSSFLLDFDLLLENGNVVFCSREENAELFEATCGGMGLTGIIVNARFKLTKIPSVYIKQLTKRARNLEHVMELFEQYQDYTYSVAWIDCVAKGKDLGRSVVMLGEHAEKSDLDPKVDPFTLPKRKKLSVPINFPSFALNSLSVKIFNTLYYNLSPKDQNESVITYDQFFYPLDSIHDWNKIYGRKGFVQYQFVLPKEDSVQGMPEILEKIVAFGTGSFLAVFKLFGPQDNMIAFPKEGYTLALDFPVSKKLFQLLDELDELVLKHNGRIYLAKDARMKKELFHKMYPGLDNFEEVLKRYNPNHTFHSIQSERLAY